MNTKISYQYRDADNYKQHEEVILHGQLTEAEKERILAKRDEGEYFIPSQVGLPDLQERMINPFNPETDHVWHELEAVEDTDKAPTIEMQAYALLNRFDDLEGWNDTDKAEELGL